MSYRHLDNIDEKIIAATIDVGSKNGANRLSTKEIAKACGVSEFVIYDHFKTKEKLVNIADKTVFDQITSFIIGLEKAKGESFENFFSSMVDYFLSKPDITAWTLNYGHVFPQSELREDQDEFNEYLGAVASKAMVGYSLATSEEYSLVFCWIIRNIVSYATLVINKVVTDSPELRGISCQCSNEGLKSLLK
jgi:AcrR family transcriptional regulator